MIKKTERIFKRRVKTGIRVMGEAQQHIEQVRRKTWWLLWILPVFSADTIMGTAGV